MGGIVVMDQADKANESLDGQGTEFEMCQHFINAFQIIGKKWNGLIISSLCAGKYMRFKDLSSCVKAKAEDRYHQRKMRFKDLSSCVKDCSDRVLVERLKELEKEGIVCRSVDEKTKIISYGLTKKGADLQPVFDQIHDWADKWE